MSAPTPSEWALSLVSPGEWGDLPKRDRYLIALMLDAARESGRAEGYQEARPDGEHKWGLMPDYATRAGRREHAQRLAQRCNRTFDLVGEVERWLESVADLVAAERTYAREEGRRERDAEVAELRAEVERARAKERAAVVADLRERADRGHRQGRLHSSVADLLALADRYEHGAHLPPETTR